MEAYPPTYVEHNLPLVLLSGLGHAPQHNLAELASKRQDGGARIVTECPECIDDTSKQLLKQLLALDGGHCAWNASALPGPSGALRYCMRTTGRSFVLPARKAAPHPQSPGTEGPPPRPAELHSPLSPLSPGSPIYPDGLFTPLWFSKHQRLVPSLLIIFFKLNAEGTSWQDEQLKSDILAVRSALTKSGYKTRPAVVLMSDKSILQAPELEDRLASIRRATGSDTKTGLFFMPPMSTESEIATFVQTVLTTLQPLCIEYYRDLSKHARRKKGRGGPLQQLSSPIVGGLQAMPTPAWNVRYEVKQGVFAEFRQEMEGAERHYSAAIEELFGSEGALETTHSWSPRWNEARLLSDCLAIRALRAQLWIGANANATQFWLNYKLRMKDLIDRRGKGSYTYSWDAWEARWAEIISQLLQRTDLPNIEKTSRQSTDGSTNNATQSVFVLPEKTVLHPEQLVPFNFLHHSGYWLRIAAKRLRARWERALAIPEEDRIPPGQSPASAVAQRSKTYDTYLAPDPHEEHQRTSPSSNQFAAELEVISARAVECFNARDQFRMSEETQFDYALDLFRGKQFDTARQILAKLWEQSSWRSELWHGLFCKLLMLLLECISFSKTVDDAEIIPAAYWELLSIVSTEHQFRNFTSCLQGKNVSNRISLSLDSTQRLSPIYASFAFKTSQTNVGEQLQGQLVLEYITSATSPSITISRLGLKMGSSNVIALQHKQSEASESDPVVFSESLRCNDSQNGTDPASVDLSFNPFQKRILNLSLTMREAQMLHVTELHIFIETPEFTLNYRYDRDAISSSSNWHVEKDGDVDNYLLPHVDTKSVEILPKPPKLKVNLIGLRNQYYTDECVTIVVELVNEESEIVEAVLSPKAMGQDGEMLSLNWPDLDDGELCRKMPRIQPSESNRVKFLLRGPPEPGSLTFSIDLQYTLASDPNTTLNKTLAQQVDFVVALEVNFSLAHLLHTEPWPSYFDSETAEGKADGISQLWRLNAPVKSFASDALHLHKLELIVDQVAGDAVCSVEGGQQKPNCPLRTNKEYEPSFGFVTRKLSLDDRRPIYLDLSLAVIWSRGEDGPLSTTTLAAPRFTIPTSEPRVLCTIHDQATSRSQTTVCYHLENPSGHFLTFALTMEASEEFAFSGPKYRTLSLAPLSRHTVSFRLLLHETAEPASTDEDGVWVSPSLQVIDSYYQKNLRVYAGGPGVKLNEKKDISVWVQRN